MDDPSRYAWYGEKPFPWVLIGIYLLPVLFVAAVITIGMLW